MRPVTEMVDEAMVLKTSRAAVGPPPKKMPRAGLEASRSQAGSRKPRATAATTLVAGTIQKGRQIRSHNLSRGISGIDPRIRKLVAPLLVSWSLFFTTPL